MPPAGSLQVPDGGILDGIVVFGKADAARWPGCHSSPCRPSRDSHLRPVRVQGVLRRTNYGIPPPAVSHTSARTCWQLQAGRQTSGCDRVPLLSCTTVSRRTEKTNHGGFDGFTPWLGPAHRRLSPLLLPFSQPDSLAPIAVGKGDVAGAHPPPCADVQLAIPHRLRQSPPDGWPSHVLVSIPRHVQAFVTYSQRPWPLFDMREPRPNEKKTSSPTGGRNALGTSR